MAKSSFKLEHPLAQREVRQKLLVSERNIEYPFYFAEDAENGLKRYLVPADLTLGQLVYVVQKRIRLSAEKAISVFVKNTLPPTGKGSCLWQMCIMILEMFTRKRPTNAMFKDDLNPHMLVMKHLMVGVTEIIVPILLEEIGIWKSRTTFDSTKSKTRHYNSIKSLISVLEIGVVCSAPSMGDHN